MENHESRGGNWARPVHVQPQHRAIRSTRNYTYANALLGVFSEYTETSRPGDTFNRGLLSEWFAQDTWKPTDR